MIPIFSGHHLYRLARADHFTSALARMKIGFKRSLRHIVPARACSAARLAEHSYCDGHLRNARQAKYPPIALDLCRGPQGFLKVVREFDRRLALDIVQLAYQADRIERVVPSGIAVAKVICK